MRKTYGILLAGILCFSCGCGYETETPKTEQTEKIKLTILAGQSTSDAGTEDMLTEAIQEEFPDVELEWECADWGDGFDKCLQARFSAGDLPDIIIGKSQDVSSFAELELIDEIYLTNPEAIYEEALDTVCIDGKIYGLPYTSWYQGVLYNKDLFEKYGVQIPKTNEELKELVQFFEEHGEIAFASHFQESWKTGNLMMQLMLNEILKEDSDWGEDFRKGIHHYKDNPQIIWCLKELKYISEHSFSDCMLINQAECDRRFDEEMAAMYPGGCWSLQFVNQFQKDIHYGIFPYPVLEESDLIRETNMTFMKSAYTEKGALIDSIFDFLLED